MGRSPFFYDFIRPVPLRSNPNFQDLFNTIISDGNISDKYYNDFNAHPKSNVYIKVGNVSFDPPLLDRSCSVYRGVEDHFPETNNIYKINRAVRIKFSNEFTNNTEITYDFFEVSNIDTTFNYFTTFCIRTDGTVLNIESLNIRGYIIDADIVYST